MKIKVIVLAALLLNLTQLHALKILHLTLHEGCKMDFKEVAQELGLELTSWFVQELERNEPGFWEGSYVGNEIYNVGPKRANRIWDKHKDFFETFDVVITSDTAPLSRIFLQNGWTKPLIIWICNRFDYFHPWGGEEKFPDPAYYRIMQAATQMKNVHIVSYTQYEHVYARMKGIEFGNLVIKPIGRRTENNSLFESKIPRSINKSQTIFVYPRFDHPNQERYVLQNCKALSIPIYTGTYNGPDDLRDFKGVIYFPYQWSNLALFEGMQRGVIHFVPSEKFILENQHQPIRHPTLHEFSLCEWYAPENRACIVYFDSWHDLKHKIETTDYKLLKTRNLNAGLKHRQTMLNRWQAIFDTLINNTFILHGAHQDA